MPLQFAAALFTVTVAAPVPRESLELASRPARAIGAGPWMTAPGAALRGHNDEKLTGVSLDSCKAACIARPSCKSFDYGPDNEKCCLSDSAAGQDGVPDLVDSVNYDHYALPARTATAVMWVQASGAALKGHNDEKLTESSLDSCKAACIARPSCKSFDYGPDNKKCCLSDSAAGQDGVPDLVDSVNYDHYALTRGGLEDGEICALGTTCNTCKREATYWWSKAATCCGSEVDSATYDHYALARGPAAPARQCDFESTSPPFAFGRSETRSARSSSKRDTCVRSVGQTDFVGTARDTVLETAIAESDETVSGLLEELAGADGLKRYAGTAGSLLSSAGLGLGWGVTHFLSETGIMGVDDPKVLALETHADCVSGQIDALWEALDQLMETIAVEVGNIVGNLHIIDATTKMEEISSTMKTELMGPLSRCLEVNEEQDGWAVPNSAISCTDASKYEQMLTKIHSESANLRIQMDGVKSKLEYIRKQAFHGFHWGIERPIESTGVSRTYHSIETGAAPPPAIDFADTRQIVLNLNGLSEQAIETVGLLKAAMTLRLAPELHDEPDQKEPLEEWAQEKEKGVYDELAWALGSLSETLEDQAFVEGRTARSDRFREKMVCANPMHLEDVWGRASSKHRPGWCTPSKTEFVHQWLSKNESAGLFECAGMATAADRYEAKLKEYCNACVDWGLVDELGLDLDQSSCENPDHTMWCSTSDVPAVYAPRKAVRNTPKDPGCKQFDHRNFVCPFDFGWGPSDRWVKADKESDCAPICDPAEQEDGYFRQCIGYVFFPSMKACYLRPHDENYLRPHGVMEEDLSTYGPGFDGGSDSPSIQSSKGAFGPLPDDFGFEQIKNQFYSWDEWAPKMGKALKGYNDQRLTGSRMSLDSCKKACIDRPSCKSFDYGPNNKKCDLSDSAAGQDGVPDLVDSVTYDHYELKKRSARAEPIDPLAVERVLLHRTLGILDVLRGPL